MKAFLKDLAHVGASKGVMIASSLLTSIITARWLGPEKNGLITSLLVYPGLFMSVGSLGMQQSTTYFTGKGIYTEEQIKRAVSQIWLFSSLFSVVASLLLIVFLSTSEYTPIDIALTLLQIPFTLFITYSAGFFLGKNQIAAYNRINWLPGAISLVGTALFVIVLPWDMTGYMIALLLGPFAMFFVLLRHNKLIGSLILKFDWTIIKDLLKLGVVYAIALFVINLNYRFDVVMLDRLSTPYELGIYSKGANFIQFLWQIPMLLSTIVFVRSAVSKNNDAFSLKVAQLLRLSFVVILIASLVLMALADWIVVLLFGSDFAGSAIVIRLLAPGVLLLTIFKVMNMDLAGKGRPSVSLMAMLPGLIINVVCNYFLIPRYGAVGASISSTISYTVLAVLFLHFYSKTVHLPIRKIILFQKDDFKVFTKLLQKKGK